MITVDVKEVGDKKQLVFDGAVGEEAEPPATPVGAGAGADGGEAAPAT